MRDLPLVAFLVLWVVFGSLAIFATPWWHWLCAVPMLGFQILALIRADQLRWRPPNDLAALPGARPVQAGNQGHGDTGSGTAATGHTAG